MAHQQNPRTRVYDRNENRIHAGLLEEFWASFAIVEEKLRKMASTEGLVPITRASLASYYEKYPISPLSTDVSRLSDYIHSPLPITMAEEESLLKIWPWQQLRQILGTFLTNKLVHSMSFLTWKQSMVIALDVESIFGFDDNAWSGNQKLFQPLEVEINIANDEEYSGNEGQTVSFGDYYGQDNDEDTDKDAVCDNDDSKMAKLLQEQEEWHSMKPKKIRGSTSSIKYYIESDEGSKAAGLFLILLESSNSTFAVSIQILAKLLAPRYNAGKSFLHSVGWERIVLDEAHYIKERCSNSTRAVLALQSSYKGVLSGTPLQNRVGGLYSLVRFLQIIPYSYYFCKDCDCRMLDYSTSAECPGCAHKIVRDFCWWNKYISTPRQDSGKNGGGIVLRRTKKGRAADLALPPRIVTLRQDFLLVVEEDYYTALYNESLWPFMMEALEKLLVDKLCCQVGISWHSPNESHLRGACWNYCSCNI